MSVLSITNTTVSFGGHPLLDDVELHAGAGEKICIVGRNASGKSTLLKIIAGLFTPNTGNKTQKPGIKVRYLPQDIPAYETESIFEIISDGFSEESKIITEYNKAAAALENNPDEKLMHRFEELTDKMNMFNCWDLSSKIKNIATEINIDTEKKFSTLSAGMKRKVVLAQAVITNPDVLLLDEPTNHMDIESIIWMEDFIKRFENTLIMITHDRTFMQKTANKIVEIDRGKLYAYKCDYENFLIRQQNRLEQEKQENIQEDKKLAKEEAWIRQGIKARRTRNQGRVKNLQKMREKVSGRRHVLEGPSFEAQASSRTGQFIIKADKVEKSYDGHTVVPQFSIDIMKQDRIGIIGKNGVGKTTLLKILTENIKPDGGHIKTGSNVKLAYFDQLTASIDDSKTIWENICDKGNSVLFNGRAVHIITYLQNFLFTPERAKAKTTELSGGERKRLLLAKLFTKDANVLVLDEPTNDLDIETLELLEEILSTYDGTVIMISHDRQFIDNTTTKMLVFDNNQIVTHVGTYDMWLNRKKETKKTEDTEKKTATAKKEKTTSAKKLSYKEQKELDQLPKKIEALEEKQTLINETLASPDFYKEQAEKVKQTTEELKEIEETLKELYSRWENLEERASSC